MTSYGAPQRSEPSGTGVLHETDACARSSPGFGNPVSKVTSILIYYDGSVEARCALRRAAELVRSCESEVHVLAVAETLSAIAASAGLLTDVAYGEIIDRAWHTLDEALADLGAHGTDARGYVSHGRVVDCIARQAALVDADLIVIGYRHRRSLQRWWR
jgi:nucleotide-binding universal stress UspA family protein